MPEAADQIFFISSRRRKWTFIELGQIWEKFTEKSNWGFISISNNIFYSKFKFDKFLQKYNFLWKLTNRSARVWEYLGQDIVIITAISLTLTDLELLYSPIFSFVMTLIILLRTYVRSPTQCNQWMGTKNKKKEKMNDAKIIKKKYKGCILYSRAECV